MPRFTFIRLLLIFFLLSSIQLTAQESTSDSDQNKIVTNQIKRLDKIVNLTDNQEATLVPLFEKKQELKLTYRNISKDNTEERIQCRNKIETIEFEIQLVLTSDQKELLSQHKSQRKEVLIQSKAK